jgi:hypothetical protein
MIALASDCLVFRMANGESMPFSADTISVELMGSAAQRFSPEFLHHATKAVFHYFQKELGRTTVTVEEFVGAFETALNGFKPCPPVTPQASASSVVESDLCHLVSETEGKCELFFFPRLRQELRLQLQREPRLLRFHGLRGCAMQLAGARRWTTRCQGLREQIVAFLRECLNAETKRQELALVID